MATTNGKTAARERAREAKAKVDAARVEKDKLIEEQATAYYLGSDEHDKALAAAGEAETKMAAAVLALGDLDVPVQTVATLCGVDARRVRQLRKAAKDTAASTAGRGADRSKSPDKQAAQQQTEQGAA